MENQALRKMSDEEYLDSLPPGYRFNPTDEELLINYLMKRISNEPLEANRIREVNLYRYSPQQLYVMYKEPRSEDMYFFTPRDRKYPKGNRPNRVARFGYWKASGSNKPIKSNNIRIGYNRSLVYYEGKYKNAKKTDWLMHEYTLDHKSAFLSRTPHDTKLDDWVICKVYRRQNESKKEQGKGSDVPSTSAAVADNETSETEPEDGSLQTVSNENVPQLPTSPLPDAMYDIGNSQMQLGGINYGENYVSKPFSSPDVRNVRTNAQSLPSHNGQIISHDPDAMFYANSQQMAGFCGQNGSPFRMMPNPAAAFQGTSSQMPSCYGQNALPMLDSNLEFLHPDAVSVPYKYYNHYPQANQVFEDPSPLVRETHMVRGKTQISFPMPATTHVVDAMSFTSSQSMRGNYIGQYSFPTGHFSDQVLQCQYYNNHYSETNQDLVNPIWSAAQEMNTAYQVPNISQHVSCQIPTHEANRGFVDGCSHVSSTKNGCSPSSSSAFVTHQTNQQNYDKQFGT